jgi:hypothetical protein
MVGIALWPFLGLNMNVTYSSVLLAVPSDGDQ